jgi:type I restriction enzyme S subunit
VNHPRVKIGDVAKQIRGVSYDKSESSIEAQEGYVPLLRGGNVQNGRLLYEDLVFVPNSRVAPKQRLMLGDIVIVASSGSLDVVGKAGQVKDAFEGTFGAFCKVVRPSTKVDQSYLGHFFQTPEYRNHISAAAAGININNLRAEHIDSLEIPLPPLDKQRRIATILDQADDLRRKRREALDRLDQLGGASFYELFGEPRTNPRKFEFARLGDIIDFVGGSQPPKSTFLYEDGPDRVRFIQIRDFSSDEYKTYIPARLAKRPFEKDDVMIGRYGPPVFQIFRGLSGSYNVALMKAQPCTGILKEFVYYLLQEQGLHSFVVANSERTAGQSGVNLALLDACPAYAPPVSLQEVFSARVAEIDKLKAHHCAHLAKLDALFASLQHRAFRGEL